MSTESATSRRNYWRGLGLWNVYFIAKLILYAMGYLNFHAFYNLLFVSVLLMPLPPLWLHRVRHAVAVPAGIALLYYDSWLPPFQRLMEQPEVLQFSAPYLLELANRFINWNMVGAGVILFVSCMFLSQWIRVTVISVGALMVASLPEQVSVQQLVLSWNTTNAMRIDVQAHTAHAADSAADDAAAPVAQSPGEILSNELDAFYESEASRRVAFDLPAGFAPDFDIVFLNVCSVAWADLASVQLDQHPLLNNMDVVFDEFNSATSYSGPAVRRLLRASCGQPSHESLYDDAPSDCYLFEQIRQAGFQTSSLLNHNGQFQDFISDVAMHDSLGKPAIPADLPPRWTAFDGSPIWGDYDTLHQWWQGRKQGGSAPQAVLYNSITLHDGNREATADGGGRPSPYASRGQAVLDDLNMFVNQLQSSDRRVVLVLIPEHGAALEGDMMQISGMREIPTPDIAHVPVGVKLIGRAAAEPAVTHRITGPSSYLALSELLARIMREPIFDDGHALDWEAMTADLPQTRAVSENSGTVLMSHGGVPYVRLGDKDWIRYRR